MKLIQTELNIMNAKDSIILKTSSGSFAFKDMNRSGAMGQTQADPIVVIKDAKMWFFGYAKFLRFCDFKNFIEEDVELCILNFERRNYHLFDKCRSEY